MRVFLVAVLATALCGCSRSSEPSGESQEFRYGTLFILNALEREFSNPENAKRVWTGEEVAEVMRNIRARLAKDSR